MKRLFFDCETTGLDCKEYGIVQISGLIIIDEKEVNSFDLYMCPQNTMYDQKALDVHGYSIDDIIQFPSSSEQFKVFKSILDLHIDKYNRDDKFTVGGYNVAFDLGFLKAWFESNDDKYLGSYINWYCIDPLYVLYFLRSLGWLIDLKNYKLETVCKYFGIELKAHDALSDVRATYQLTEVLKDRFFIDKSNLRNYILAL